MNQVLSQSINSDKKILAFGMKPKKWLERHLKSIELIRPLKDGVIADYDTTTEMLRHII